MSVLTPKRAVLSVVAVLLGVSAFASNPSPRTQAQMAWVPSQNVGLLFGGFGPFDQATSLTHDSSETWLWNGSRWLQRFPATTPPRRSAHTMVYDSTRDRVVMFGGRQGPADRDGDATFLNDTWVYQNDNWTRIESANTPDTRQVAAMAYDSAADRVILYGGNVQDPTDDSFDTRQDTWEFDGLQWTNTATTPVVAKPTMAYDPTLNMTFMLGLSSDGTARVMYRYNTADGEWVAMTPTALPTCVNDGHMVYRERSGRVAFFGGVCASNTPEVEEVWEWDNAGNKWVKLTTSQFPRLAGQAVAYDPLRNELVTFGGTAAFGSVVASQTNILRGNTWRQAFLNLRPTPRSQAAFLTDTNAKTIWLYGGLDETSSFFYTDLWGYRNGQWFSAPASPSACDGALASFDTDRSVVVLNCGGSETYEWTGTDWKSFTSLDPKPQARRFAGMAYDPILKKTVMFGGYNANNFRNDTWTWNGTAWTEVKPANDKRPPHRGQMAMWYDPLRQKIVLYGGIGRGNVDQRVTRYSDMWEFNGTVWTKIEVAETPGMRFGPQIAVNPVTGKVLLFGGLKAENIPAEDPEEEETAIRQIFVNDTWEWDGTAGRWTHIETNPATPEPDVRENGSMSWDPVAQRMVLFAGYADGFYRSDVWEWTGSDWVPRLDNAERRRAVR